MAEEPDLSTIASDPTTPPSSLADLAYDHPELRVAIARNPATYEGLRQWLSELGDPEVTAALGAGSAALVDEDEPAVPPVDESPAAGPGDEAERPEVAVADGAVPPPPEPASSAVARAVASVRRHPRASIAIAAGVVVVLVASGIAAAASLQPTAAVNSASSQHHKSGAAAHHSAPASVAPTKATGSASISVSTDNGLIADDDLYATGPLSAVVAHPQGQSSGSGSSASDTKLAFQTMLVQPTVPVKVATADWTSPNGTVFGDFNFAAQLDPASPAGFVALAAVTVPSSGLHAATTTYSLALWSASSPNPVSTVTITPTCGATCDIGNIWYSKNTAVIQWNSDGDSSAHSVQGINAKTGSTVWTGAQQVVDAVGSTLIVQDANWDFEGVTMSTGGSAWTFAPPGAAMNSTYLGYLGGDYIHGDSNAYDANDDIVTTEFVLAASTGRSVIQREGDPPGSCLCDTFSNMVYDAVSDDVIVEATSPIQGEDGTDIEVVKAADGSSVYTLPADGLAAIGTPPLLGATNGSAWIQKNGKIDLFVESTGAEDPSTNLVASEPFIPDFTTGSISVLERSIAGVSLIVAHQNQALTVPLLAQLGAAAAQ